MRGKGSGRRLAGVAAVVVAAALAMAGTPLPVAAHALGGTFTLPVPLWLYLAGAATAVGASFVVTALASRSTPPAEAYPTRSVPPALASSARLVLRVIGLAWWYGGIVAGLLVSEISPLPAVLLWIGIWVGLPIVAVLIGNPWPSLSPFRSTFAALEWLAARAGVDRLDLGVRYPPGLARWPAVMLLAAGFWLELVLPGGDRPATVAVVMAAYTALTLAGMLVFGPIAWLRHAELLEVVLASLGRIGPVGRRSRSADLCAGCGEACNPDRCVDCPECSTAADDGERSVELRPPVVGLTDIGRPGWSDVGFILLLLAGVTYDGLGETVAGTFGFSLVYPVLGPIFGETSLTTFLLVEAVQLGAVYAGFAIAFLAVSVLARGLSGTPGDGLEPFAGRLATTLLPIAGGYLVAHYGTLVVQGLLWLPMLLVDANQSVAPPIDPIPIALVWYVSVAAIVGGHVAGVVLAHRLAVRHAPSRATIAGLPMIALMIGYTILSLWTIATPIVVEPSPVAAGLAGR